MNYDEMMKNGIRRTVVSFDPFLKRGDVRGLTDAQVGKKFGLATKTVKAITAITMAGPGQIRLF